MPRGAQIDRSSHAKLHLEANARGKLQQERGRYKPWGVALRSITQGLLELACLLAADPSSGPRTLVSDGA